MGDQEDRWHPDHQGVLGVLYSPVVRPDLVCQLVPGILDFLELLVSQ